MPGRPNTAGPDTPTAILIRQRRCHWAIGGCWRPYRPAPPAPRASGYGPNRCASPPSAWAGPDQRRCRCVPAAIAARPRCGPFECASESGHRPARGWRPRRRARRQSGCRRHHARRAGRCARAPVPASHWAKGAACAGPVLGRRATTNYRCGQCDAGPVRRERRPKAPETRPRPAPSLATDWPASVLRRPFGRWPPKPGHRPARPARFAVDHWQKMPIHLRCWHWRPAPRCVCAAAPSRANRGCGPKTPAPRPSCRRPPAGGAIRSNRVLAHLPAAPRRAHCPNCPRGPRLMRWPKVWARFAP